MLSIREQAEIFLDKNEVKSLPVDVIKLADDIGYKTFCYTESRPFIAKLHAQDQLKNDGFSIAVQGEFYIFFRPGLTEQELQTVIAHEIGHIALHFTGENGRVIQGNAKQEQEADDFGLYIRAPLPILYKIGALTPMGIEAQTNLSQTEAQRAACLLDDYRREQKANKREKNQEKVRLRHFRKFTFKHSFSAARMLVLSSSITTVALMVCCVVIVVFFSREVVSLQTDAGKFSSSTVSASHMPSLSDPLGGSAEESHTSPAGGTQPSTDSVEDVPQVPQSAQQSQTAAQQPAGYVQPKQPGTQASSSQVYTPPASSSAPVVPPVSSAAPPASSAAPPESSSVPDYVIPVKPKEPYITINANTRFYWTGGGTKYHLFEDCYHIRDSAYQKESGLVADAKAAGKDGLCADCITRNNKNK